MAGQEIKLPLTFNKNGYRYNQHVRAANKAIYKQYAGEKLIAYEVVIIKHVPARYEKFLDKEMPAHEKYPTTTQWGIFGWTCKTSKAAHEKYSKL